MNSLIPTYLTTTLHNWEQWAAAHVLPASVLAHVHAKETHLVKDDSKQERHDGNFGVQFHQKSWQIRLGQVLRRDEIPSDVGKAMQRLRREYGE